MPPTARLNIFQKLVLRWDALHPYNAAQIFRLRGTPDLSKLQEAWDRTLAELKIGSFAPSANASIAQVCQPLDAWITAEMNERFGEFPFKPFLIAEADSYFLGIVYHHWAADSASIRLLMREWFYRLFDPSRAQGSSVPTADGGYWRYFGPGRAKWELGSAMMNSLRWSSRFRRVRRVESAGVHDFRMRFALHRFEDGAIDAIRAAARRSGATVNDWFLAAIAQVCADRVAAPPNSRREDLALGTIVDLRARSKGDTGRGDLGDAFGLFLGFTNVILRPDDLRDFPRLVQKIATQTRQHKVDATAESSMLRIAAGVVADKLFGHDPKKLVNFYRKRFPLAAGISNVLLNGSWVQEYHPHPLMEYIRVSPTGPMMPVVFTTTTLGNQLNFGLSTREAIVNEEVARRMAHDFVNILVDQARRS